MDKFHVNPAVEAAAKRARDRFRAAKKPSDFDEIRRDLLTDLRRINA